MRFSERHSEANMLSPHEDAVANAHFPDCIARKKSELKNEHQFAQTPGDGPGLTIDDFLDHACHLYVRPGKRFTYDTIYKALCDDDKWRSLARSLKVSAFKPRMYRRSRDLYPEGLKQAQKQAQKQAREAARKRAKRA